MDHVFNRFFVNSKGGPAAGCVCGVIWNCDQNRPRSECKGPKANKSLQRKKRGYRR